MKKSSIIYFFSVVSCLLAVFYLSNYPLKKFFVQAETLSPLPSFSQELGGNSTNLTINYSAAGAKYQYIVPSMDITVYEISVKVGNWGAGARQVGCKITDDLKNDVSVEALSDSWRGPETAATAQWQRLDFRNSRFNLSKDKIYRLYCRNASDSYESNQLFWIHDWGLAQSQGLERARTFIIQYCPNFSCSGSCTPQFSQENGANNVNLVTAYNYTQTGVTYFQPIVPAVDMFVHEIYVKAGNWGGAWRTVACKVTDNANNNISVEAVSETFRCSDADTAAGLCGTKSVAWRKLDFRNNRFSLVKNNTYRLYCRGSSDAFPLVFWVWNWAAAGGAYPLNEQIGKTYKIQYCPKTTLSASLFASPSSGNAPLQNVVLTAGVSGSALGTINYTFYCNRSDTGTDITSGWAHKLDGTNLDSYPAPAGVCDSVYATSGTYKAKVIAERGALADEERQTVIVNQPPTATLDIQNSGGSSIASTVVDTNVYLYVGGSSDADGSISTVEFCSDDSPGDSACNGTWTSEYNWTTSSGDWNATTKKKTWSFATAGNKGVYAQVKDNNNAWSNIAKDTIAVTDFSISDSPDPIKAPQTGTSQASTITVSSVNGFSSVINLSVVSGCPTGATCNPLSPASVTLAPGGSANSTLTVITNSTPAGSYTLTIRGTSGSLIHETTVILQVVSLFVDLKVSTSSSNWQNSLSGTAPINGVDLQATVSGTAQGTILYSYDCTNDGTWDYNPPATNDNLQTITDACNYPSIGTYTARVRVQRDVANWAYDTATVTVTNNPPFVIISSLPAENYCISPAMINFQWIYQDPDNHPEDKFQIQIDDKINFSDCNAGVNCDVDYTSGSGLNYPSGSENNYPAIVSSTAGPNLLVYDTTYYWRVKVWDIVGGVSVWTNGSSLTTALKPYPNADFSDWVPAEPRALDVVNFFAPTQPLGVNAKFDWQFQDGNPSTASDQPNPSTTFLSRGTKEVTLVATDRFYPSCFCEKSRNINVLNATPRWQEF